MSESNDELPVMVVIEVSESDLAVACEALDRCAGIAEGFANGCRRDAAECLRSDDERIRLRSESCIEKAERLEAKAQEYRKSLTAFRP